MNFTDAQAALGFLISQTSHIERTVWEKKYPDITYPQFVPVDNSAHEWATSVTYYSTDKTGQANWLHHRANDFPTVDLNRTKHETAVAMAGIGYDYDLEELNQARMLNINLTADKASAARRAYEEMCERVAYVGDTQKGFTGLLNNGSVSAADVADGAGAATTVWETKTVDEVLVDINAALTGIWTASNTIELADTILLPLTSLVFLNNKRLDATMTVTLLEHIKRVNVYTMQTGQPLKVLGLRQLETAGAANTKRMVTYKRDPEVVKMHIPMPLKFLPPQGPSGLLYQVPGMFRLGGVDIRRPGAVRYSDAI